jgi:uncharacterized phage-associated protein
MDTFQQAEPDTGTTVHFRFNVNKTIQAVGLLIELEGFPISRMRLLKLLYITDRELLTESGRPLTGDVAVAMKYGPVLSHTFDLIKGIASNDESWREHFENLGYKVLLKKKPERTALTKRETEKLIEVTNRYRDMTDDEMSDLIHGFKEWVDHFHEGTSTPIPWREILAKQGRDDLISIIEEAEVDRQELEGLVSIARPLFEAGVWEQN